MSRLDIGLKNKKKLTMRISFIMSILLGLAMALPAPVEALCTLIEKSTPCVRAACLRADAIDALMSYIANERVVKVLHLFRDTLKGKRHLGRFVQEIGCAFCHAVDSGVTVMLFEILESVPVPIECGKVVAKSVSIAVQEAVDVCAVISLLGKTTSTAMDDMLGSAAVPAVLDERSAQILLYISKRTPRAVAQRCGAAIVQYFVECQEGCAAALVLTIAPMAGHASFRLDVLDCLAHSELQMAVFHLVYRWVQIPGHGSRFMEAILASASWSTLRNALVDRLQHDRVQDSPFHTVIPLLLLVVMSASTSALNDRCIEQLSCYLQRRPAVFTFLCEDEPGPLQRVVDIGERLGVADSILQSYRSRLEFAKAQEKLQGRLLAAGFSQWTPPDAFQCPVTKELMRDPVVASDGHSYERATLTKLFQIDGRSPLTRELLHRNVVIPNINLKKRILELPEELIAMSARKRVREED